MKNKKLISFGFVFLISFSFLYSQENQGLIKWLTFEEVKSSFEKNQKPVFIFVYQQENDSCKMMFETTFSNKEVADYINVLFYPVKIDVYTKETLTFLDGKKYSQLSATKKAIHPLVTQLLGEKPHFPAIICFNKKTEGTVVAGYKDRDQIFPHLIFQNEEIYNSTTYEEFEKNYFRAFPLGRKQVMTRVLVKWKTLPEALELQKTAPKKIFLDLNVHWKMGCSVMNVATYANPKIAAYLNENFYCVTLYALSTDTINVFDRKFFNEGKTHGFHQLPIALLNGKMNFPALLIFNETGKIINLDQVFFTTKDFEVFIHFFGGNAYKTTTFPEFKAKFKGSFD